MEEKVLIKGNFEKSSFWKKLTILGIIAMIISITIMSFEPSDAAATFLIIVFWAGILLFIISSSVYSTSRTAELYYELVVTDNRVYGKIFKNRVDLPLDSITSTSYVGFDGISIFTPSGKIIFRWLKNRDAVYNEISKLIRERQETKNATVITQKSNSNADELKKYKDLLDSGAITQEEFDLKKEQLLGL